MIFIIAGMIALIVIHFILQCPFLGKIGTFRGADIIL